AGTAASGRRRGRGAATRARRRPPQRRRYGPRSATGAPPVWRSLDGCSWVLVLSEVGSLFPDVFEQLLGRVRRRRLMPVPDPRRDHFEAVHDPEDEATERAVLLRERPIRALQIRDLRLLRVDPALLRQGARVETRHVLLQPLRGLREDRPRLRLALRRRGRALRRLFSPMPPPLGEVLREERDHGDDDAAADPGREQFNRPHLPPSRCAATPGSSGGGPAAAAGGPAAHP